MCIITECSMLYVLKLHKEAVPILHYLRIHTVLTGFQYTTVDLGCNEVKGSELKFRYNQGFVTDKVLYNMYN